MNKTPVRPAYPLSVRVGVFDFTVKPWDKRAADNTGAYGLCDKGSLTILIQQDMPIQQEAQILLHELFHACYFAGGLRDTEGDEERLVAIMSFQVAGVVRDNPDLMAYLGAALR